VDRPYRPSALKLIQTAAMGTEGASPSVPAVDGESRRWLASGHGFRDAVVYEDIFALIGWRREGSAVEAKGGPAAKILSCAVKTMEMTPRTMYLVLETM